MKRFWIDLLEKNPSINESEGDELKMDMEFFNVITPEEITEKSPGVRVFKTQKAAENFLDNYLSVFGDLKNKTVCKGKGLPSILMKRPYIALTVLGLKMKTVRNGERLKNANVGDLVNMYDQTHFHTVRLTGKIKNSEKEYVYTFENVK